MYDQGLDLVCLTKGGREARELRLAIDYVVGLIFEVADRESLMVLNEDGRVAKVALAELGELATEMARGRPAVSGLRAFLPGRRRTAQRTSIYAGPESIPPTA